MSRRSLLQIGIVALLALPAFIVFAPVLFFGRVFADGDALLQFYPAFHFFRDALTRGDSWLWTPGVLTGFPLAASLVGGFFSPVNSFLVRVLGVFAAYHWIVVLNFVLTGWFTYALARRLGIGWAGAALAGLALPWSTAYVSFGSNITVSNGYWLLPLLLWVLLAARQQSNRRTTIVGILVGGAGTGLALLTAHTQWPLQALVVAAAWAVFLDVRERRSAVGRARPRAFAAMAAFLAMIALGVFIAWPQLRLTTRFAAFSARQDGISLREAFSGGLTPVDLGSYLLPRLNIPHLTAAPEFLYVGALPLLLLIVSFWLPKGGYARFFRWLFGLALVASFQYSPLFFLIHWIPGLNFFRVPSRWMYAGNLAIAVLAGYALEYVFTDEGRERLRQFAQWAVRWVAMFGAAVIAWSLSVSLFAAAVQQWIVRYFDVYLYRRTTQLPLEHYHDVIAGMLQTIWQGTTLANPGAALGVLALIAAAMLLKRFTAGKLSRLRFCALAIVLTFVNLVANPLFGRVATVPVSALTGQPEVVGLIRAREESREPFRVFGFLTGFTLYDQLESRFGYEPSENVALQRELLSGNLQLLYGLDGLDDYDNLMDRRSARVLGYLGGNRSTYGENLAIQKLTLAEKEARFVARLPILSAFNVKYVVSAYPLNHPDLRVVGGWRVGERRIELTLYENLAVRPRYYLVGNVRVIPPQREDRSRESFVKNAALTPFTDLIECDDCSAINEGGLVAVSVVHASNTAYTFTVETQAPRWFVFGQTMLPGWRASIDGATAVIYRANYLNQAVYVPAGQHRIEFRFGA